MPLFLAFVLLFSYFASLAAAVPCLLHLKRQGFKVSKGHWGLAVAPLFNVIFLAIAFLLMVLRLAESRPVRR